MCSCLMTERTDSTCPCPACYRGAPGRLMRLEDMQALLDDFGIPLQIGSSSSATKKKVRRVVGVALQEVVGVACRDSG